LSCLVISCLTLSLASLSCVHCLLVLRPVAVSCLVFTLFFSSLCLRMTLSWCHVIVLSIIVLSSLLFVLSQFQFLTRQMSKKRKHSERNEDDPVVTQNQNVPIEKTKQDKHKTRQTEDEANTRQGKTRQGRQDKHKKRQTQDQTNTRQDQTRQGQDKTRQTTSSQKQKRTQFQNEDHPDSAPLYRSIADRLVRARQRRV
jgi:hypothetical protein